MKNASMAAWSAVVVLAMTACGAPEEDGPIWEGQHDHHGDVGQSLVDPAPNCIGEPADHPAVTYPEQRVFLESQGWWGEEASGTVPKFGDAEHLHIGACFPLQKVVAGSVRLDFRVVGHNLPAGSVIFKTRLHDGAMGADLKVIDWNRTVAAGERDVVLWRSVTVDTRVGADGLREVRPLTRVIRPDDAEIHASGGWCWDVENGKTDNNRPLCTDRQVEGRGWYDCFEYKTASVHQWNYPYGGIAANAGYTLSVSGRDGAGGTTTVDRHWAFLNPNFHQGVTGTTLLDHAGAHSTEPLTIPGTLLTPGVHVLFLMAEERANCSALANGEVSGGIRLPIQVN